MAAEVTLRPVAEGDRQRLLDWRNSPEVAAYMYTDHRISPEEHARWFDGIAGDKRRAYWIIEVDGTPAGLANFYDIDRTHGRAAWAYYLADPSVRGKGVGGYVEYWMISHAFAPPPPEGRGLGLRKLWCEVLASNEAVWRLHEKFGFKEEARFRGHVLKGGAPQDVLGLGLLAAEWQEARPTMAERLQRMGFVVP